jgi:Uma2 family endonuclease
MRMDGCSSMRRSCTAARTSSCPTWQDGGAPTLAELPDESFLTVAPDCACEILSPSTRRVDRVIKRPIYRREQVRHGWLIDPEAKTLEVYRLEGAVYGLIGCHAEDERVRVEAFDALEFELAGLWLR